MLLVVALSALVPQSLAAQMLSGSYVGNGNDNRNITQLGFEPDIVIVKGNTTQVAVIRTSTMVGDAAKPMTGATALTANLIQSLDLTGFTVGNDARVNASGVTYYWVAWRGLPGRLTLGTYTGNGAAGRTISGVGFPGDIVFVMSQSAAAAIAATSSSLAAGANGLTFFTGTAGGWFQAFTADGFTLNNAAAENNASGVTYHYVVWNQLDGHVSQGSYVGDGADNRNISGLGFEPEYVVTFSSNGQESAQHSGAIGAAVDDSMFFNAVAGASNRIQALQANGFQVGTALDVNETNTTHFYMAWSRIQGPPQVLSGSYTGNGSDNRSIAGLGFRPDFVIVKGQTAQTAVFRSSRMFGDAAKPAVGATGLTPNLVQSLDVDGFTVGTDVRVNGSGIVYHWIAFSAGAGEFVNNNYTGNGVDNRSITGLGFQPEYVIVMSEGANDAVHRSSPMVGDISFQFDISTSGSNLIQAVQSDGFQVGTDARVNANGTVYQYVAWNRIAGKMEVGSYAGNGSDDRAITGVGFQPEYVVVRPSSSNSTVHHSTAMGASTDWSERFWASAGLNNAIQALQANGFEVGTDATVNVSGNTYYWMAWKRPTLTAVRMGEIKAARTDKGTIVRWRTGYEVDNLGFHVYRERGGERTRVTTKPIAGSALMAPPGVPLTAGYSYKWTDHSEAAREPGVAYWVQDVDLDGTRTWHGPITPDSDDKGGATEFRGSSEQPRDRALQPADVSQAAVEPASPAVLSVPESNSPSLEELTTVRRQAQADGAMPGTPTIPGPVYSGFWTAAPPTSIDTTVASTRPTETLRAVPAGTASAVVAGSLQVKVVDSSTGVQQSALQPAPSSAAQGSTTVSSSSTTASAPSATAGSSSLFPPGPPVSPQGLRVQPPGTPPAPARVAARQTTVSGSVRPAESPDVLEQWNVAAQASVRIDVRSSGWYRLGQPTLVAAGISGSLDPRHLRLLVDGVEQPIIVTGESDGVFDAGDTVEFYATGVDTPFTDRRPYWITDGPSAGLRVSAVDARNAGTPAPPFFAHTVEQRDRQIFFGALQNGEAENFFGPLIMGADAPEIPVATEQQLTLTHLADSPAAAATLEVALQGVTARALADDHRVAVALNGTELGEMVFDGRTAVVAVFDVPHTLLVSGVNTIALEARLGIDDMSLVQSVRLTYQRKYVAEGNRVTFEADPGQELTVGGFTNDAVRVFDITGDVATQELFATVSSESGGWTARFTVPGSSRRKLLLVTSDAMGVPASVHANVASTLHNAGQAGEIVMIADASFVSALSPLKSLRESQGYSVKVVDIQDVYDEFSFGQKRPAAIRTFLTRASETWAKPPRFVLLVGNATTDPRDYQGIGEIDFVPTQIVSTGVLETASDDWFVDADGDGFADVATIGRLPARSAADVDTMVGKIVAYEQSAWDSWHQSVLLVSDQGDGDVNEFSSLNDAVAPLVPNGYQVTHLKRADEPDAAQALRTRFAEGQVLVNYQGHGSVEVWRGDVLTVPGVPTLGNGSKLPLVVAMTCFGGFFQGVYPEESLAEALLRQSNGGAVGVWASSGMTDARWQSSMDRELFRQIFSGSWTSIGEAIRAAKKVVGDPDVRRTWIYFGDPALRMKGLSKPPVETNPATNPIVTPPAPDPETESEENLGPNRRAPHLSVHLADFDGNGRGDALIAQPATGAWFAAIGEPGGFRYMPGQLSVTGEPIALRHDADSRSDVFVYNAFSGAWLLGVSQSDGTFLTSTGNWASGLEVTSGDFDGNGREDIFAHRADGSWFQALSDGLGGFMYRSGTGLQMGTAYAADFNGDARTDVLVYSAANGTWTMMFSGSGVPTMTQGAWTAGWQPIVAYLNGDASADLVLWHEASGAWVQCIRDTSEFFTYRSGSLPAGGRLHIGNFVGDSRDDILRYDWRTGEWSLVTLEASGSATEWDGLWEAGWELTPGKLNGDALDDLLLYNPDTGEWVRRLNLSTGWADEGYGVWSHDWTVTGRRR